jgi:transcriptional regulator with XRE-family HTH domain
MRAEHRKTQDDVAKSLNVSRAHYTALEGGRSMLNFDQLVSLAVLYRVSLSEFLEGVP